MCDHGATQCKTLACSLALLHPTADTHPTPKFPPPNWIELPPTPNPNPNPSSIPDVISMFSEVSEARETAREDRASAGESEQELRDQLSMRVSSRQAGVSMDPEETARIQVAVSNAAAFFGGVG